VTDSSGAAVAGASIEVKDIDRSTTFRANSNERGFYVVNALPPGRYQVSAERTGFRRYVLEQLPIATQQKAALDITLEVGAVSESVTITGSAQIIDTSTATLSGVVENKRIVDLPLNGRNVYSLAALTPGVFGRRPATGINLEGFHSIGIFTVNGGRDSSNAILMDGVPVTVNSNTNNMNANTALPTVEGVEEFRIQTNSYSAEYGRSGGGVLTIATKSGTNELHGSLFDFLRNSRMDANNFFANRAGRRLGTFQRNEFGASVGGPILIPKLYDGRNKTFFFNAYEGRRQRSQALAQFTLPTDLELAGDFSRTLNAQGAVRTIYDPFTTSPDPSNPGQFMRQPFTGNQIPRTRMDPVSVKVLEYYGARPNSPGQPNTGLQNFVFQGARPDTVNRDTFKIDHNINDAQRFFVRYTIFDISSQQPEYWSGPGCPDGGCFTNSERQQNAAFDYTNMINTKTLMTLRYGFARSILNRGSWYQGFRPSTLGLPASVERGADLLVFPQFGIEEMTAPGLQHHWNFRSANMSHTLIGTVSRAVQSHSLKTGVEFRSNLINHMQAPWQLVFNFNRGMTAGPNARAVSSAAGTGFASFLLGAGAGGQVTNGIRPALESKSFGIYLQDDWKVSRRLTLNLGLRWDWETGLTERYNRFAAFDPSVRNPLSERTGWDLKGGWLFPEKGLPGRNLRGVEWRKIAPRVGIAYQMRPNTIIRTGFGMFYAMAPYGANHYGTSPFGASTPWLTSLDGITPNHLLNNPFPNGVLLPEGSAGGLLSALGLGMGGPVTAEMTTPYNMQWNFTIAQQLGGQLGIELAYAGNKGVHLPFRTGWYMDQLPASVHRPDAGLLDLVPNPFFGIIPVGAMSTQNVQRGQLFTPYPHYPGVNFAAPGWGNSNYHSFQAKIEKRFSSGNSVVLAYTMSKLLSDGADNAWDAAGVTDFNCRACAKSVSPYDQRHRLVTSFTYDLPFGKGKQYGSGWNSFLNGVFGQWQINGIGTINSGLNLQFGVPQNTSFSFGGGQRPDVVAGQEARLDNPTIARWFNTDAFRLPAQYTFGTIGRMHPNLRSDRVENLDFSVFKNFRIKERATVQFRAEWFNLTNSPIFGMPNTTVGSTAFGIVTGQDNLPRQTQLALKFLF
jgi:hypothetical protein